MKIDETKIWNDLLSIRTEYQGKVKEITNHNVFRHEMIWYDAKTTTVKEALNFTRSEDALIRYDQLELLLLIRHTSEEDDCAALEFNKGLYIERDHIPEPIYEFRYCDETKDYQYAPIEGELLAFSLVNDLPLMIKFNEDD